MRAVIPLLVLLFFMCEVQTESQSTGTAAAAAVSTQLDVSAELRELRDTVVELRTTLSSTQNELQNTKSLQTEVVVLKARLTTAETEVLNLRKETAAQEAELTAVKTRLAATETDVVNLEKKFTEQPKVAFSAGLGSGYIESGNTELNLVFTRIITNVGQAYSNTTGFFTAPVRGVYNFRFSLRDDLDLRLMGIMMYKNAEQIMHLVVYDTDGKATYLSSGVNLQLEEGDVVNMRLPKGHRLYDTIDNHSTFSGFLLFSL
ncbi:cerebellin-2-like [Alosa sapidissima]|uniref:cerebellin-2-like n=1 Tax=Alosa sapidissima TaxID=34773 RepID=UPI001C08290A|nr:cerebellin-2-like [Alosa sapidissima]